MDKRRLILGAMWIAALGGAAAIYFTLEPEPELDTTLDSSSSPRFTHQDRAEPAERAGLEVEDDDASSTVYRGGRRHTGRSEFRGPSRPSRAWRAGTGNRVSAQPVVAEDGVVFIGSHGEGFYAIGPDGSQNWVINLEAPVWSAAAVLDDGSVVIGSDAGSVYRVNREDGRVLWRLRTGGEADGGIAVGADGTLYFTAGRHLFSVDPENGDVHWRFSARGAFVLSTPAIDSDGTLYVAAIDDYVYAVASDGQLRWDHESGGDISSSPMIGDDGTIYFGSDDRHVYALTRDGERRWRTDVGGYVRAPVALGRQGDIIVGVYGPEPRLVSLDAADGHERWFFPVTVAETAEIGIASGPLIDRDGNIYFGAQDDFLYSLSSDGHLRWFYEAGGDIDSAPILARDGLLIVGSDDGYVYAIEERAEEDEDAEPELDSDPL